MLHYSGSSPPIPEHHAFIADKTAASLLVQIILKLSPGQFAIIIALTRTFSRTAPDMALGFNIIIDHGIAAYPAEPDTFLALSAITVIALKGNVEPEAGLFLLFGRSCAFPFRFWLRFWLRLCLSLVFRALLLRFLLLPLLKIRLHFRGKLLVDQGQKLLKRIRIDKHLFPISKLTVT